MPESIQKTKPRDAWFVECSKGHKFFTDNPAELINEEPGREECPYCRKLGLESEITTLECERCATDIHLACPEDELLDCRCECQNNEMKFMETRLRELESDRDLEELTISAVESVLSHTSEVYNPYDSSVNVIEVEHYLMGKTFGSLETAALYEWGRELTFEENYKASRTIARKLNEFVNYLYEKSSETDEEDVVQ